MTTPSNSTRLRHVKSNSPASSAQQSNSPAVSVAVFAAVIGVTAGVSYYLYQRYGASLKQQRYSSHLLNINHLNNTYYGMRHGESEANLMHLISSDPTVATQSHGLTDTGFQQAQSSARQWADQNSSSSASNTAKRPVIVISSDFKRAAQTAETLATACDTTVIYTPILRERNFGSWNGTSDENYKLVWKLDAEDAYHTENEVESVVSVVDRVTRFILQLEKKYNNANIVLVAHGDVLQITQTAFAKTDPRQHRSLKHLPQAEIRPLPLA